MAACLGLDHILKQAVEGMIELPFEPDNSTEACSALSGYLVGWEEN